MKNCFKKVVLLLMVVFSAVMIASCGKDSGDTIYYEVKYIVENTEIANCFIKEGQTALPVAAKEIDGKTFQYWTLNGKEYDFTTPVTSNLTFIASYLNSGTSKPTVEVSAEVKAELEKVVPGAVYTGIEMTETGSIKAEYKAVKGKLTTTIYYLEKGNNFTTVKMYVGINSGKIVNILTVESDTVGKKESFNGTTLGVIGSTSETLNNDFTVITGVTISSTTVKELLVEAFDMYAAENSDSSDEQILTVTFDTDGGTTIDSITVENGKTFVRPNDPTRSLYHFTGWYVDDKPYDFTTPVTKDITLVAKWVTVFQFDSKTQTIVDAVDLAGDVEIPTMINGIEVKNLGENLFKGNKTISSVTIPASIEKIAFNAFENCTALEKVTFLGNATSNPLVFGNEVFKGCTALKDITFPANAGVISSGMFEGCTSLIKLPIAGVVVTIANNAFKGCTALEEMVLPEGLKEIAKNAFDGCTTLPRIVFPESLATIGQEAFKDCVSMVTMYIPSGVTQINLSAFAGCTKLGTINVSNDNTKYSSISGALYNKTATTLILVPNRTLKNFEIPATVDFIEAGAFENLVNLETITVNQDSVKYITEEGVLYSKSTIAGSETTKIELIPAKYSGVVKFLANTNNVASNVFANCPNIATITVDSENQYFVEIDHIIYKRTSPTSKYFTLVVANRNFSGVATVLKDTEYSSLSVSSDAFANTKLTGIRLTWNKPIASISNNIFASVPEGFKVYIPNGTMDNYTGITNTKWRGEFKEAVVSMLVEETPTTNE